MNRSFNPLERPDRYDLRLETERHSEAASRAACVVPPMTPERQFQADLRNQKYGVACRLDQLYLSRREPSPAVVIDRDGRWLTLYDRHRICWSLTRGEGTRLTAEEALDLQRDFPLYLANTTIRSLTNEHPISIPLRRLGRAV